MDYRARTLELIVQTSILQTLNEEKHMFQSWKNFHEKKITE